MRAADFSNWARIPTTDDIAALKAMGATRVVVGASFPRKGSGYIGADQLAACVDFERQVYGWLYLNADADWRHPLTMALQAYATIPASIFWIDVEEEPIGLDQEGVRQRIRDAIAFTGSADIYTRVELWNRITGDWNIVAEYPNARLWKADPPPDDGLCGGFDHATMIQTDFDTDIGTGFEVDLSEYECAVEEDEGMKPFLVFEEGTVNQWLVGFAKPVLIGSATEAADLAAAYGPPKITVSKGTLDQMVIA